MLPTQGVISHGPTLWWHLGFPVTLLVYVHKPRQATVALREAHRGTGCTCHGLVFGGSGRTHGTCQKQLEPRSAAFPAWHPVRRQMNFSLVNFQRLALKSAATDANGWMLSWHFCAGMFHVACTTLSTPSYLHSTLPWPPFSPSVVLSEHICLWDQGIPYHFRPCISICLSLACAIIFRITPISSSCVKSSCAATYLQLKTQ